MLSLEQALQQMLSQLATINKTETLTLEQAVALHLCRGYYFTD